MSEDQRVSDLQAEYAKHLESWDRTRELLTRERALLLWLHAEAVWQRDDARTLADRFGWRLFETRHAARQSEASRQAWAEEALRLDDVLERRRRQMARALNMHQLASWDELQTTGTTYAEQWLDNIAAQIDVEERAKRAEPPTGVCACPTAEQLAKLGAGFTRPQCTVHPTTLPCGHTEDEAQRSVRHELCNAPTDLFEGGSQ